MGIVTKLLVTTLTIATISATNIRADDSYDVTFRTGVAFGTLTFANDKNQDVSGSYGGIPIGIAMNRGFSSSASFIYGGGVLLDLMNSQVVRQGLFGGIAWHLIGGPREYTIEGAVGGFTTRSPTALSLMGYGGLQNFAATDASNRSIKVSGSVFQFDVGLEYRYDLSDKNAFVCELVNSLFTLPASTSRIRPRSFEFILGWRTFI